MRSVSVQCLATKILRGQNYLQRLPTSLAYLVVYLQPRPLSHVHRQVLEPGREVEERHPLNVWLSDGSHFIYRTESLEALPVSQWGLFHSLLMLSI